MLLTQRHMNYFANVMTLLHPRDPGTYFPARRSWPAPSVERDFVLCAALGAALVAALQGVFLSGAGKTTLVVLAGYIAVALITMGLLRRHYVHAVLGWCNAVTIWRAALTVFLLVPLLARAEPGWLVPAVATLALLLDGLDGWLARRHHRTSRFGARFDVEVDAAFALVLTLHALAQGFSPAVLMLALTRYAFVAAALVWPWMSRDLPERAGRKWVCVYTLVVLILLLLPGLPEGAGPLLLWPALLALFISFGRDLLWLWQRR
jgi:phosphatidylglycerophosphate synthase